MVVMLLPSALATGVTHERTASPLRMTVQAPHCAMPQPNFVPVNPSDSRSTQRSGVAESESTTCGVPFTVSAIDIVRPLSGYSAVAPGHIAKAISVTRNEFRLLNDVIAV